MHNIATHAPKAPPISIAPNLTQLTKTPLKTAFGRPRKMQMIDYAPEALSLPIGSGTSEMCSCPPGDRMRDLTSVCIELVARPRATVINRLVETKSNFLLEK